MVRWSSSPVARSGDRTPRATGTAASEALWWSWQPSGAGIQIDSGQRRLQQRIEVFGARVQRLAADQQQLGKAELSHLVAARGQPFVLIESGQRVCFEDA